MAEYGSAATLSVTASGSAPLLYQWLRNGTAIPGATASSLTLQNMSFSDAAVYGVIVGNNAGTVISAGATVKVAPKLTIQRNSDTTLLLTWPGAYVLQSAPQAAGPYSDVSGAVNPLRLQYRHYAAAILSASVRRLQRLDHIPDQWLRLAERHRPCRDEFYFGSDDKFLQLDQSGDQHGSLCLHRRRRLTVCGALL
jgi:hypothetical protein